MAQYPQTIEDFYALATEKDFARLHQLRIVDWVDKGHSVLEAGEDHIVYLETAQLPNREIANQTVPFMGLTFNVPGLASYAGSAAYAVSLRCDADYYLRRVVEHFTRRVFNDATSWGDYNTPGLARNYLTMTQMDKNMNIIGVYTLVGANIVNTGAISYNLGDTGSVAKVDCTLSYHYWVPGGNTGDGYQAAGVVSAPAKQQAYATPILGPGAPQTWQ